MLLLKKPNRSLPQRKGSEQMLRVKKFKVKAEGKIYCVGETLPNLHHDDEKRLIDAGIAEEIVVESLPEVKIDDIVITAEKNDTKKGKK
jgi:hypothetical protein